MSEQSSLCMRVKLTEKSFEAFKNSPLVFPNYYNDWEGWLSSKELYGEITGAEIQALDQRYTQAQSVDEFLSFRLQNSYAGPATSQYDSSSNTWTLCITQYSDNYKDFILVLSILRAIEQYKDIPGEDFILIYPYFWGGDPDAYVKITAGNSEIVSQIPVEVISQANLIMQNLSDEVAGLNEDDV